MKISEWKFLSYISSGRACCLGSGRLGRPLFGVRQTVNTSTAIEQAVIHALHLKSDVAMDVRRLMRKKTIREELTTCRAAKLSAGRTL